VPLVASQIDLGIAALNQRNGGSIHGEKLSRSWNSSSKRSIYSRGTRGPSLRLDHYLGPAENPACARSRHSVSVAKFGGGV
jgi:hypothetical protein